MGKVLLNSVYAGFQELLEKRHSVSFSWESKLMSREVYQCFNKHFTWIEMSMRYFTTIFIELLQLSKLNVYLERAVLMEINKKADKVKQKQQSAL